MGIIVKAKLCKLKPSEITLTHVCASMRLLYKNNGNFTLSCADNDFYIYKEPLCYISPVIKALVQQSPNSYYKVPTKYSRLIPIFRSFVYRKYCIIPTADVYLFTALLKHMEVDFSILFASELIP